MAPQPVLSDLDDHPPRPVDERARLSHQKLLLAAGDPNPAERQRLHDEVVMLNVAVADSIAHRYGNRGVDMDDLEQVAHMGLVKAVADYDPEVGSGFDAYAVPTIRGEIRRFFRDNCWTIRPTRRIQELQAAITAVEPTLTQRLGHMPTVPELATAVQSDATHILEALAAEGCFHPRSLDLPIGPSNPTALRESIGDLDDQLECVEQRHVLHQLLMGLCPRDLLIVQLRFFHGWSQREIGEEIGVSQMQVSRLLSSILARLRDRVRLG